MKTNTAINYLFAAIAAVYFTTIASMLSPQLILVIPFSLLLAFIAYKRVKTERDQKVIIKIILGYIIIEMFLKISVFYAFVAYSWVYINRVEHFLGAIYITIMISFIFSGVKELKSNKILAIVTIATVACTLGVINEIFEYFIREGLLLAGNDQILEKQQFYGWIYYEDTMHDLIVNIFGIMIAIVILNARLFVRYVEKLRYESGTKMAKSKPK